MATDVAYRGQSEVDAAAKALSEQIAGASAEFEGTARGNPKIRAGTAIAIDNLGAPFDGKYVVTSSRHVYDPTPATRRTSPSAAVRSVAVRARVRRRARRRAA